MKLKNLMIVCCILMMNQNAWSDFFNKKNMIHYVGHQKHIAKNLKSKR
jgi:hypothetical protein